jgi:hypothetical protein
MGGPRFLRSLTSRAAGIPLNVMYFSRSCRRAPEPSRAGILIVSPLPFAKPAINAGIGGKQPRRLGGNKNLRVPYRGTEWPGHGDILAQIAAVPFEGRLRETAAGRIRLVRIRRALADDVGAVRDLTRSAYAKWIHRRSSQGNARARSTGREPYACSPQQRSWTTSRHAWSPRSASGASARRWRHGRPECCRSHAARKRRCRAAGS